MRLPPDIGMRTAAVHAGEDLDPSTRASAPHLVMSTTFAVEEPVPFSALEQDGDSPWVYTRWGNPTVRRLEEEVAALEGADDARAYASGMAAISAVLFSLLSAGDRLVIGEVTYPGTAELVRDTLPRWGIEVVTVDTTDLDAVAAALLPGADLVWIETPANPLLSITDIGAVAELAHAAGADLAVDSTFATPIATRPLSLGADWVVHSLTKYIGGHGDALGGAVVADRERLARLDVEATVHHGGVISPFNAWLILRGAATLPIRMAAHAAGAAVVADALIDHPSVVDVCYPGLATHPQHDLARSQMATMSGMLTFRVADGPALAERMMADLRVVHYAVSLGHHRSLVYWLPSEPLVTTTYRLGVARAAAYRAIAGDGVFRLSVGLEDPADVIDDLVAVLP